MADRPAADPDDEAEGPPAPESTWVLFTDPGVRNYLFTGLAGLAVLFVVLFARGSDLGGLLIVLVGAGGMVFRRHAAPAFVLLFLLWFLVFPFGLPPADEDPFEIEAGRFRVADLLLVASVVVYLASHYRVFGLTQQAMPFDGRSPRPGEKPVRRPAALVAPTEISRLLYLTAGVVFAGQIVWLIVVNLEVDVLRTVPLGWGEGRLARRRGGGDLDPWTTRFVVLTGLIFFGSLLARLVFGYWRLRAMTPGEGRMILQDAGWDETRRERQRAETWRARAKRRAAEPARPDGGATR
jgi:hypothetical protein